MRRQRQVHVDMPGDPVLSGTRQYDELVLYPAETVLPDGGRWDVLHGHEQRSQQLRRLRQEVRSVPEVR
jgi:hypothetical protein